MAKKNNTITISNEKDVKMWLRRLGNDKISKRDRKEAIKNRCREKETIMYNNFIVEAC